MDRKTRYRQKITFIVGKLNSLPKEFDMPLAIDATLYRIQTAIEAVADLTAMLVKDKGQEVSDDYANIHTLVKLNFVDKELAGDLTMLAGLRNAIVHKYNSFEEDTVIQSINEIKEIIESFLEKLENELKTLFD